MVKFLSKFSTILGIIMLLSVSYRFYIGGNNNINGETILFLLIMFLNPIVNLHRVTKKKIKNPIYHLIFIVISIYISYIAINSVIVMYKISNNEALLYYYDNMLYMLLGILILLISGFMFSKEKIESYKDNSKIMFLIILVTALLLFFRDRSLITIVLNSSLSVFSLIMIFKIDTLNTKYELQKLFAVLIILSLITFNVVAMILLATMYVQLDKFGLNV